MLQALRRYKRFEPAVFFTAGFLFDVFTLRRIDDWLKLGFQIGFILLLGYLLTVQYREEKNKEDIPKFLKRIWPWQIEVVHFLFGSLLSAFVIFYFKSASFTRSFVFFLLLVVLMFLNELPRIRAQGVRLRVTLFAFCLVSFLIYFIPVLVGQIGSWLFVLAVFISVILMAAMIWSLTKGEGQDIRTINIKKFSWPAITIYLVIIILYFFKAIPPVPISMTFGGIYHRVDKTGEKVELYSLKPWYNFWSNGDKTFLARPGEPIYCFVRIFSPAKFSHKIFLVWELYEENKSEYTLQDRIGMQVYGGREQGFRGFGFKSHYQPGTWRVQVETEDGRTVGTIHFKVENDDSVETRTWMIEEG